MNKFYISIPNCHTGNKFKIEGFWFVFKSFCCNIFKTDIPKNIGGGGILTEKNQKIACGKKF